MADGLKDILSHLHNDTSQETLLKYLNGQLDRDTLHDLEKNLLEDDFENDAVEGLQDINDQQKIELILHALHKDLKKKTDQKNKRTAKRTIKPQWWLYFSILIFLIIVVLVYVYIHTMLHH